MNLGDLRTAVSQRSGVAYDADALDSVINEALTTLSTERDWPWLEATWTFTETTGQGSYSPPWSWRKVRHVSRGGRTLPMVPISQLDGDAGEAGWALEGDRLVIGPTPAGSTVGFTVRYVREEQPLTAPASTPILPAEWHPALVDYAAAILLERLERFQSADRCMARFKDAKRRMVSQSNRVKGPHRVRVRPGSML